MRVLPNDSSHHGKESEVVAPRFRRRYCACAWPVVPPLSRDRAEPVGRALRLQRRLVQRGGAAGQRRAAEGRAGRSPSGGKAEPQRPGKSPNSDATDPGHWSRPDLPPPARRTRLRPNLAFVLPDSVPAECRGALCQPWGQGAEGALAQPDCIEKRAGGTAVQAGS